MTTVDRLDAAFLDAAFLVGADIAHALIGQVAVARAWESPSALPQMSVGALACHLGRQTGHVARLVTTPGALPLLSSADEHYRRAPWVTSASVDDPSNDRSADDVDASRGHAALVTRHAGDLARAREILSGPDAAEVVDVPWQGWSLRRPDFLTTRLVEIVTHCDDLGHSVGSAPGDRPQFPDEVFGPVRDLLVRLAEHRHGQSAVVSALTRRERAVGIAAF